MSHQEIETLFAEGNHYLGTGDLDRAEACYLQALAGAPEVAELHANLGLVQEKRGQACEAESRYRRALELNSELMAVQRNLAGVLTQQKRFAEAREAYARALELEPDSAATWSNLGVFHACIKQEAEAERCYRQAMMLDPDYALARFNFSYLLLRQGRFEEGWASLEARDWYARLAAYLQIPRWQGEPLESKRILIGIEAGHGDMIQFCRYAAGLKSRGAAQVGVLCHPALKRLLGSLRAVDKVTGLDEAIPAHRWDVWVPPMSLPYLFETRLESIPADLPYLHAESALCLLWAAKLPQSGLRVGLVWKGNPRFENDAERSLLSLDLLTPLWEVDGARFISLQKGAGENEALSPPAGLSLLALGHEIGDFADTAAIISQLDLVIAVDTAVAHLAGALGKPCWVLLPDYKTDWRWLTERDDSPWYPQVMRLFRQPAQGGWPAVIAEVKTALQQLQSGW